jgi:ribosomal protein L11 methyltransferase
MIQISVTLSRDQLNPIEQALLAQGALSITLLDAADAPVLEPLPGETPLWPQLTMTALFEADVEIEPLRQALTKIARGELRFEFTELHVRDWTRAWLDDYRPLCFGRRLRIVPSGDWAAAKDSVEIRLDPGLAFGTGTHPTTALCLEWLDANPPLGLEVIDYGCGSGVLSLAAIKLGAKRVRAVDIDPQALIATRENAARNDISQAQLLVHGVSDAAPEPADLLLANILARPLIALAERFAARVKSGGRIVLSGILMSQTAELATTYAPWFDFAPARSRDDWALLEGVRLQTES